MSKDQTTECDALPRPPVETLGTPAPLHQPEDLGTSESSVLRFAPGRTVTVVRKGATETLSFQKFKLVVEEGAGSGREFIIDRDRIGVGSDPDNDLVIDDPTVSRRHLEIQATPDGHRIRDLGSTNGTALDGSWIVDAYLHAGARLGLGDVTLVFQPLEERVEIPLSARTSFGAMLGASFKMRALFGLTEKMIAHDSTLLITGETGTGKGLLAEEIHQQSPRRDKPFVVVDCSTIPRDLMESELFGHVRGAFTGAVYTRQGALLEATGGSILFDEIGELPLPMQTKLLRIIDSRQIKRVGTNESVRVNVRIMAATNRNLLGEVQAGRFREDLFFRLNVFSLHIPPLRERQEDIPFLVREFLRQFGQDSPRRLSEDAMRLLLRHDWPGNVRELRNVIERVALLIDDRVIDSEGLLSIATSSMDGWAGGEGKGGKGRLPINTAKELFEKEYLKELLQQHHHNVSAAARAAGIHRQSFHRLLRKHGIKPVVRP